MKLHNSSFDQAGESTLRSSSKPSCMLWMRAYHAAAADEFFMRAAFDNAPIAQHKDAVGLAERGDAVADDDAGQARERRQRLTDLRVGLRIYRRE